MIIWVEILIIYLFILLTILLGTLVVLNCDEIDKAFYRVFGV